MKNLFDKQYQKAVARENQALDEAYRNTHYKCLDHEIVLKIGDHNTELDTLLSPHEFHELSIVTAWNPYSIIESEEVNRENQQKLISELKGLKDVLIWNGVNVDPADEFPDEPTIWILGLSEAEGHELAKRWGQNAFVHYGIGGVARLIWCNLLKL